MTERNAQIRVGVTRAAVHAPKVVAHKVPPAPASRTRSAKTKKKVSPPGCAAKKAPAKATKKTLAKATKKTAPKTAPAAPKLGSVEQLAARPQRPASGELAEASPAKKRAPELAFGASPAEVLVSIPHSEAAGALASTDALGVLGSVPAPLPRLVAEPVSVAPVGVTPGARQLLCRTLDNALGRWHAAVGAATCDPPFAAPSALALESPARVDAPAPNLERLPITEAVEPELVTLAPNDIDGALAGLPPEARADLAELDRVSRAYEEAATAAGTLRTYQSRFRLFVTWCRPRGLRAVPAHPEVVRLYLVALVGAHRALSTIEVALAAIAMAHTLLSHRRPMSERLRVALRKLRKTLDPVTTQPAAIDLLMLRQIVVPCREDLFGVRDRALLLLTYFGGLLRSETANLDRERTIREVDGYVLWLGRTRGAPKGKEKPVYVPLQPDPLLCPVRALDRWLAVRAEQLRGAEVTAVRGPVFLSIHRSRGREVDTQTVHERRLAPEDVYRILRRRAESAGFAIGTVSAHGLRAGVYTEAARDRVRDARASMGGAGNARPVRTARRAGVSFRTSTQSGDGDA